MVDVEADLRRKLAQSARDFVVLLRRGQVATSDAAVNQLAAHAFGSPERLADALELLGEDEHESRALLTRARYAVDPRAPEPPRVGERPDAGRYGGSEGRASAPGGGSAGGGCYSGGDPQPTS
jgi:hypothetical protein